jgi:hypothetical protein
MLGVYSMTDEPLVGDIWSTITWNPVIEKEVDHYYLLLEKLEPNYNFFLVLNLETGRKRSIEIGSRNTPFETFWRYES